MTEEFPDDVEAWIELGGILEQSDIQVYKNTEIRELSKVLRCYS